MLTSLAIAGYRSIRDLVLPLAPLTVVTGANGSGKSSLYRSLRLLAAAGRDGAVAALAREGGLASTLWAGPESGAAKSGPTQGTVRRGPVALRLGFAADADGFGYAVDLGLPPPSATMFGFDPTIKAEAVWNGPILRPGSLLSDRRGPVARIRTADGWRTLERQLAPWESMLAEFGDPESTPELLGLRAELRDWRFYDAVRTDAAAPGPPGRDRNAHSDSRLGRLRPRGRASDDSGAGAPPDPRRRRGSRPAGQPHRDRRQGRRIRPAAAATRTAASPRGGRASRTARCGI